MTVAQELRECERVAGLVKDVCECHLSVEKLVLFGSRARGDFNEHSDYTFCLTRTLGYQFLVVIFLTRWILSRSLRRCLEGMLILSLPTAGIIAMIFSWSEFRKMG